MDPATAALSGGTGTPPPPAGTPGGTGTPPPPANAYTPAEYAWDPGLKPEVTELLKAKAFDKNPNALATSYYESNRLLSGATDIVAVPGKDAPQDMVGRFRKAYGVPDAPDAYEDFKFKTDNVDPVYAKWAKGFLHRIGVPAHQAQSVIDDWQNFAVEHGATLQKQAADANTAELDALKTKHGEKWDTQITAGKAAFKALGLSPELSLKVEKQIGSAALMELMFAIGAKIPTEGANGVIGNGSNGTPTDPSQMTLEQLDQAKVAYMANPDNDKAYWDANNPRHKEVVEHMLALDTQRVARMKAAQGR